MGVPDRLPRTTSRILAHPSRACPVGPVQDYWQRSPATEPFFARHYPNGEPRISILPDSYVTAGGIITPGPVFRAQHQPATVIRVMRTNPAYPTQPTWPRFPGGVSPEALDALAREYEVKDK